MKKYCYILMFLLISIIGLPLTVSADEGDNIIYDSLLPDTFSYDVALDEIATDIEQYIEVNNLGIEINTEEYAELMYNFCFTDYPDLSDTVLRYYQAYASVYLSGESESSTAQSSVSKTIGEVREENKDSTNRIIEEANKVVSSEIKPRFSAYDLYSARAYAEKYAVNPNSSYVYYSNGDCTNFASQILASGGMAQNDDWKYNPLLGTGFSSPFRTWVNAQDFTEYWSLWRGFVGPECTSLGMIESNADAGDFLAWRNLDSYIFYHVQFVQSKNTDREIFCTQHTPGYYNVSLRSKITSSTFNNQTIVVINFY